MRRLFHRIDRMANDGCVALGNSLEVGLNSLAEPASSSLRQLVGSQVLLAKLHLDDMSRRQQSQRVFRCV
jgi:hypothetical protein